MAIEIKKRPFYYSFSANPVHYELYSAQAAADVAIYFEVRVCFVNHQGVIERTAGFPYSPVNGLAQVDIKEIVEGFLEYELPDFTGTEKDVKVVEKQTGFFYIEFREITPSNSDQTWDASEEEFKILCIKGGISEYKYQGNNFFTNYFDADNPYMPRPFFTWQQRSRLATSNERMYLPYLLIDDVPATKLKVIARATFNNGSTVDTVFDMPVAKNKIYFIPAGATQLGLTLTDLDYWEIFIEDRTDAGTPNVLSELFRYTLDRKHYYNHLFLHYRNSLGGLDSVRIAGVTKIDRDHDYQEIQKIRRPDYFDGHFFDPQKRIANNKELRTWRGDIGHLEKDEQDRLTDAYFKEAWREIDKKWVPVNIITKQIAGTPSDAMKWSLPIDFTYGHDGDTNYTPDDVDLGEGTFTSNVCLAYLGSLAVAVAAGPTGYKTVSVSFVEIDPDDASTQIKWRVIKQSDNTEVLPWTTVGFVSPVSFNVPTGELYIFEARAVCANNIPGKKVTAEIDATGASGGGISSGSAGGFIYNETSVGVKLGLYLNGTLLGSVYVGAYSSVPITLGHLSNAEVKLKFMAFSVGVSPSQAYLYGPAAYTGAINGDEVVFTNVTITTSCIIEFY